MIKFERQYKQREVDKILKSIVILVDTREKVWSHIKLYFKSKKIDFEVYGLNFGDYSFMIPKNEELGILEDIYFNNEIVIERKANAEEISGNLTNDRERFKREFDRGNSKIRLLIEDTTYSNICDGKYGTDMESNSFVGSLHSIQEEYNAPFFFSDKEHSGQYIYNTFKYYLRNILKQNINN
jgi:ERCC4-type nuclease